MAKRRPQAPDEKAAHRGTLQARRNEKFLAGKTRTNLPGTCLFCGRGLRKDTVAYRYPEVKPPPLGPYTDNAFCSMACGYSFGIWLAARGSRLHRKTWLGRPAQ